MSNTAAPRTSAGRRRRLLLLSLLVGVVVMAAAVILKSVHERVTARRDGIEMTNANGAGGDGAAVEQPLLSYEFTTRHPTKLGNLRLVVDKGGAVRVQRNDTEPPEGQAWAAELPKKPSSTIARAQPRLRSILDAGHFFEMEEHQVNEAATDGTIRVLRWNGAGGPRTVTVDRARSPAFDKIIGELSRLLSVPGL